MSTYIKSKSKTGKTPRTGNRYEMKSLKLFGQRVYAMIGQRTRKGKPERAIEFYDSPADAKRDGWVRIV